MRHSVRSPRTHTLKASRGLAAMAAVLIGAGSICLLTPGLASAAGSGLNNAATIADANTDAPLTSGASTDEFTLTLPANAACDGDTANDGFHIYSYLVPKGTDVTTLTFIGQNGPPTGSFGLVNNAGVYFGPVNTAITTGQVISLPVNFEWAPLVTQDGLLTTLLANGGVWEAGLLCSNTTGAVTDSWNTEVTFTASGSDANGFVWATAASTTPPPTTTTTAPGSTGTTPTTAPTGIVGTTSTTAAGDPSTSTTTTTAAGGAVGATGTGSSGTGSTGSGSGGAPLPFTGAPVTKFLGAGLLAIGVALVLLGWANRRVRLARSNRSTPR
jgi:hypothetical protein